ncbi:hypothetical protein CACET_c12650 [Clostridium aceticum]|uniref:Uncharacterized protein n=1 Tax=Clostridium aceticum TaxID=84022 RepID=A0A0D8IC58_9CLOT|nr:hypothetical protein CACET_c12650 [Clostridium aceticum]KJF27684.1 hypothetical protein TZ02_03455 [Clostridium aceticum]
MQQNKDNKNLEKSYKLLVGWILSLLVITGLFSVLQIRLNLNLSSKVVTFFCFYFIHLYIISLFLMIYKTERVYYINYVTYKEAQEATREERRAFAYKHLRVFCIATIIFIIYSIISLIFEYLIIVDIGVFTMITIISAIRTVPFRLKEK